MTPLQQALFELNACGTARIWVGNKSPREAWETCARPGWMFWYLGRVGVDQRLIVKAACACARLALVYVPASERRVLAAIQAAEAWAESPTEANSKAANAAGYAAYAAYAANANSGASHAAYAASEASYAAGAAGAASADRAASCAAHAASYAAHAASYATYATYAAGAASAASAASYAARRGMDHNCCRAIRSAIKLDPRIK